MPNRKEKSKVVADLVFQTITLLFLPFGALVIMILSLMDMLHSICRHTNCLAIIIIKQSPRFYETLEKRHPIMASGQEPKSYCTIHNLNRKIDFPFFFPLIHNHHT
jgi:hypothetical protein